MIIILLKKLFKLNKLEQGNFVTIKVRIFDELPFSYKAKVVFFV